MRVTHLWGWQMSQRRDMVRVNIQSVDGASSEVDDIDCADEKETLRGEDGPRREGERGCGRGSHGEFLAIQPGARAPRRMRSKTGNVSNARVSSKHRQRCV